MLTFIKWQFWLGVFVIAIKLCQIAASEHPRKVTFSLGEDIVAFIFAAFFATWAWFLIYRS